MLGRSRFTENDPRNAPAYDAIWQLLGEFSLDAARDALGVTPFRYRIPLPPVEGSAGDPIMAMDLPPDADQIVVPCAYNDLLDGTESYLVITGPATWRDTGGKRLAIGAGSGYPVLQCRDLDENLTVICDAKSLAGEYPELVVDNDAAGTAFATFNGGHFCRASDFFASLSPDWSALHLWNGKNGVPYAEAADGPAPGASDYLIAPGDMLCLIAAQTAAVSDQEPANPG